MSLIYLSFATFDSFYKHLTFHFQLYRMKKVMIDIRDVVVSDRDPSECADTLFTKINPAQLEVVLSSEPADTSSTSTAGLELAGSSYSSPLLEDTSTTQATADGPEEQQDLLFGTEEFGVDDSDTNNNIRYTL